MSKRMILEIHTTPLLLVASDDPDARIVLTNRGGTVYASLERRLTSDSEWLSFGEAHLSPGAPVLVRPEQVLEP